jgi:hypothetical protein
MVLKIAILYTGEFRTIEKTIPFFKQNVLLNNDYHVFSVIQTNNDDSIEKYIRDELKYNLKSFLNYDKNNIDWIELRENLLKDMNVNEDWKNYLRRSGSMIEYNQMYLAYKLMDDYETIHNFKYDYVIRFRTDTVLKEPISFDWIHWNTCDIKNVLFKIKEKYKLDCLICPEILKIFINIIFNEKRLNYDISYFDNDFDVGACKMLLTETDDDIFIQKLSDYLKNANFVVGLRINVIYFMHRSIMDKIHVLGVNYGKYKYEKDMYWFNAECQLIQICLENNIDFYSSTAVLEDKSLYEYNRSNYFDNDNNLKDDSYSFFIMRN